MDHESRIERALCRIAERLDGTGVAWVVGGSAGLMLRGLPLPAPPRDLDLYADPTDAEAMHEALSVWAVDRPVRSVTERYESILSHYRIEDVHVELVGGFVVEDRGCRYEVRVRDILLPEAERRTLEPCGTGAAIVPLAHELWFNWLRGRRDRLELAADAIAADPDRHLRAFRALTADSRFTPEAIAEVESLLSAAARHRKERAGCES
ncbi:hypothetical protein Theco_1864 [Thermobacillus composti KWC4]|jgi:hypothetical protein|uniref:Uncharacterized protein n=2 Tax=Thermobacillus TaxID=76632 RepID=L0EEE9_THECK|nr:MULTISPECIES: hypothetical protein [Thermobacillus]AGA57994.1 hypothetical protein Theco_1864 [Thermobacillus composti KWC4]REJ13181.1 MAG: hypothetical protein C6W59_11400 [Paenibacillaceae bacterium]